MPSLLRTVQDGKGRSCVHETSVFFSCQGSRKAENSQMVMISVPSPKKDYVRRKEHRTGTKVSRRVSHGAVVGLKVGQLGTHLEHPSSRSITVSLVSYL